MLQVPTMNQVLRFMQKKSFKIKLGYIPISKFVFSWEDAKKYKQLIEDELKQWGIEYVNIDALVKDGMIHEMKDIDAVVDYLKKEKVDAIFCPHCNFGTEAIVGLIGKKMEVPLLLWGPRDEEPNPDGTRNRDTLCGLMASSKILVKLGVPFTYIENCSVDDKEFKEGFDRFIRVASVVKGMKNMRIGQVGSRIDFFWTTIVNESQLLEKFNIQILPIDMIEIIRAVKERAQKDKNKYVEELKLLKKDVDLEDFSDEKVVFNLFALRDELLSLAEKESLSGFAIQTFFSIVEELGTYTTYTDAILADLGLPVSIETDIHGAVSSVLLQHAIMNDGPTFLADITMRHPQNEKGILLWHCSFPLSLKDPDVRPRLGQHWILKSSYSGMTHWRLKQGEITLVRFDEAGGKYRIGAGEAKTIAGPDTLNNYIWVEVKDWERWEKKLIYGPYIHHISCAYGRHGSIFKEATRYFPEIEFEYFDD